MPQALIPLANPADTTVTMTSRELVDFINNHRKKEAEGSGYAFPSKGFAKLGHDDFMRKCPEVLGGGVRNFSDTYVHEQNGQTYPCYRFPKREATLMAMSYSYALQAAVYDHMTALEAKAAQPAFQIPATLSAALRLAAEQAEQIEQQQAQLAITAPKAQALDRIAQADGEMCITNAAKTIGVQPKKLFEWMERHDWIYRRPGSKRHTAYQARIKAGYLTHKVTTVERSDGSEKVVESVIVTPRGLAKLAEVAA